MHRYTTIEEAKMALTEVILDVSGDMGEDAVESAYSELVNVVTEQCTPEVAAELRRRELGIIEPEAETPADLDEHDWWRM